MDGKNAVGKNSVLTAFLVFLMLGSVAFAAIIGTFQNAPGTGPGGCTIDYAISSPAVADAVAGRPLSIPVTITSRGTCSGTADVIVSVPTGWAYEKVSPVALEADQPKTVEIIVNPPAGARTGTVTFGVVMNNRGAASSTTVNIVEPEPQPQARPQPPQPEAQASGATGLATANPVSYDIAITVIVIIIAALYFVKFKKKQK